MVYNEQNQTKRYPVIPEHFRTTKGHFFDDPSKLEPRKVSTQGKLYSNSLYFMQKRLETRPRKATDSDFKLGNTTAGGSTMRTSKTSLRSSAQPFTWSGRLPNCYEGNGTFRLANNLTYSVKPVKLVPYSQTTFKSEYQAEYIKKPAHGSLGYGTQGFSTLRKSTYSAF